MVDPVEAATEDFFEGGPEQEELFETEDFLIEPDKFDFELQLKLKPKTKNAKAYAIPIIGGIAPKERIEELIAAGVDSGRFRSILRKVLGINVE